MQRKQRKVFGIIDIATPRLDGHIGVKFSEGKKDVLLGEIYHFLLREGKLSKSAQRPMVLFQKFWDHISTYKQEEIDVLRVLVTNDVFAACLKDIWQISRQRRKARTGRYRGPRGNNQRYENQLGYRRGHPKKR